MKGCEVMGIGGDSSRLLAMILAVVLDERGGEVIILNPYRHTPKLESFTNKSLHGLSLNQQAHSNPTSTRIF